VRYVVDSSSVINLFNAGALHLVGKLTRCELWLPPLVLGECGPTCAATVLEVRDAGQLHFVNDDVIDADLFFRLLSDHGLGDGETECLALSIVSDFDICCDDRRAREVAVATLGPDRVVGTLRLLRWCVEDQLIPCEQAFLLFREMRRQGGFLPETPQAFFCARD
jgi:predicted nucleic acid-binding protein